MTPTLALALAAQLSLGQVAAPAAPALTPAQARKEAATRYARALALYKEGNVPAALTEFRAAHAALPGFEVLYNIGLCQRRLFQYGLAIQSFERYLAEGGAKVPADRRAAVAEELKQIRALTGSLAVIVKGAAARVLVDGEEMGRTPLEGFLLLGPGKHTVRAERDGCSPAERTVEMVSGQAQAVELDPISFTAPGHVTVECTPVGALVSVDGAAGLPCPLAVELSPGTHELVASAKGHAQLRTEVVLHPAEARSVRLTLLPVAPPPRPFPVLGVTLLGAGAASAAAGVYFAVRADTASRDVTALAAAGGTWDGRAQALQARGKQDDLLAKGLFGLGGAAAAAGVVALAVHAATPQAEVSLLVGPTGVLAAGTF